MVRSVALDGDAFEEACPRRQQAAVELAALPRDQPPDADEVALRPVVVAFAAPDLPGEPCGPAAPPRTEADHLRPQPDELEHWPLVSDRRDAISFS
jgi:hypothetical protein